MSLNFEKLDRLSRKDQEKKQDVKPLPENYRMEEVFSEVKQQLPEIEETDECYLKLGILEEEIRAGVHERKSAKDLLLMAAHGISVIMNEPSFYTEIKDAFCA